MSVPQIAVEQFTLGITRFGFQLFDLGINVAVADQNIGPAIVVEIEEPATPSQKLRVRAQPRGERGILEVARALIVVERRGVAGEIGLDQIEVSIQIVIRRGNPHAGLRLSVRAQGTPRFHGDVFQRSILFFVIESAGSRVISHVNIRPTVIIKIGSEHAQSISPVRAKDSSGLGNVGKRAVATVVVKNIFPALQPRRSARYQHTFIKARPRFRHGRCGQVQVDVIANEKVEPAIAIVIDKRTAGVPTRALARHARLLAYVGESPVTIVVIQNILAVIRYEQILPPVVVVIADANALAPARVPYSRLGGNVGEGAIAIVTEKMRSGFAARGKAFEPRTIHQENVEPAVVVIIIKSDTTAGRFK